MAAVSLFIFFLGVTTNGFILEPSALMAKHTVIRCFSCPVDLMGTAFKPRWSTVVLLGMSAHIGVSSILAMFPRAKSNVFPCFSQNLTKFAIFAKPSLGMVCPVVALRLIERLVRCMKLNSQPRLAQNSCRLCLVASCCAKTVINSHGTWWCFSRSSIIFSTSSSSRFPRDRFCPPPDNLLFLLWEEDLSLISDDFFLHRRTMLSPIENFYQLLCYYFLQHV